MKKISHNFNDYDYKYLDYLLNDLVRRGFLRKIKMRKNVSFLTIINLKEIEKILKFYSKKS